MASPGKVAGTGFLVIVLLLALVFGLYGSMKVARLEEAPRSNVEIDLPGVKVETTAQAQTDQERKEALFLVGGAAITFLFSGIGLVFLWSRSR